jgi:hypothetical protein
MRDPADLLLFRLVAEEIHLADLRAHLLAREMREGDTSSKSFKHGSRSPGLRLDD